MMSAILTSSCAANPALTAITAMTWHHIYGRNLVWPMLNEKSLRYRFYDMLRTEKEASASGDLCKESAKSYKNTFEV